MGCFGNNETTSTVTQVPAQKSPEEIEAIRLALESLKMRQQLMPFLMENVGIGQDASGNMARLPPSPQQQQIDTLTASSLGGANEASQAMMSRLRQGQGMIPGLMASVQASMAPGTRPPTMPPPSSAPMGPGGGQGGQGMQALIQQLMALMRQQGAGGGAVNRLGG